MIPVLTPNNEYRVCRKFGVLRTYRSVISSSTSLITITIQKVQNMSGIGFVKATMLNNKSFTESLAAIAILSGMVMCVSVPMIVT